MAVPPRRWCISREGIIRSRSVTLFHERVGKPATVALNGLQNWFNHADWPNSLGFEQNAHRPGDLDFELTCGLPASLIIDQEKVRCWRMPTRSWPFAWSQPLRQVI